MTGIAKPTKATRLGEIRKRERKKADREWQAAVPPEGNCENCGQWKPLVGDHKKKRRYLATRHDPDNRGEVCAQCNGEFESLAKGVLMQKYPNSVYYNEWKESMKQPIRNIQGFIPKP